MSGHVSRLLVALVLTWVGAGIAWSSRASAQTDEQVLESDTFGITIGWSDAWRTDTAVEENGNVLIQLFRGFGADTFHHVAVAAQRIHVESEQLEVRAVIAG